MRVSDKPWPLFGYKVGVVFGKPTQETSKYGCGAYARKAMAIRVAKVAVVFGNQPSVGREVVQELVAKPRLALAWRTHQQNILTLLCCGGHSVSQGGHGGRARDFEARIDRSGAGDGAEVGTKLSPAQQFACG